MPRVVSLIASATEITCALGFEGALVGRSHECDYPPSVRGLPQVSRPAFATVGPSDVIDRAVKERLRRALSIYEVNAERLAALAPDVILTQTQCAVCAVTPADVARAACELAGRDVKVVALEPNRLGDVWQDIRTVAAALDAPEAGEQLLGRLRRRVLEIGSRASVCLPQPRVAVIEWIAPLMAAGNWMPELVELAGGVNVVGVSGRHSPALAWEELVGADPEVVVVSPCGFGLARTRSELPQLERQDGWHRLRAVRQGRVYLVDGNAYFHRPGPRLVESLEILAEILHPETFAFGHEGTGWVHA
jgi:iron complex transport system substrate-binding protein